MQCRTRVAQMSAVAARDPARRNAIGAMEQVSFHVALHRGLVWQEVIRMCGAGLVSISPDDCISHGPPITWLSGSTRYVTKPQI